jgi:hypothetical protein
MATIYASYHTRHTVVDGAVVLLDLRLEQYLILNRTATAMWQALVFVENHQERVLRLVEQFDIPTQRIDAELAEFEQDCVTRGYLQYEAPAESKPTRLAETCRTFSALRAWWSLLSTTYKLKRLGFAQIYEAYSRLAKPTIAESKLNSLLTRVERAFSLAENFFVMKSAPNDCLPRSLALYRFLLSAGIPANHCIGVRRHPFEAHAWVQCQGRVMFDSNFEVQSYTVLSRL